MFEAVLRVVSFHRSKKIEAVRSGIRAVIVLTCSRQILAISLRKGDEFPFREFKKEKKKETAHEPRM